jgi:hypothetical protein
MLGHVCVLPHEAHAVTAEASADHGSHDGHSEHDALHMASCEAVAPSVTSLASVAEPAARTVVIAACVAAPDGVANHASRSRDTATWPPLFLLHSTLRI